MTGAVTSYGGLSSKMSICSPSLSSKTTSHDGFAALMPRLKSASGISFDALLKMNSSQYFAISVNRDFIFVL